MAPCELLGEETVSQSPQTLDSFSLQYSLAKLSSKRITIALIKEYPDIVLDLVFDLSKYLSGLIERKYESMDDNDEGVDVVVVQTLHDFSQWKDEECLLPYKVIPFDDIYPQFVDPDGLYTGCFIGR